MALELTQVEIEKIKEEIRNRQQEVTPHLIEEVRRTRALGDLSENDEYRSARRELNRNYSRIHHLESMLEEAVVVTYESLDDQVGLFDTVTVWDEDEEEENTITLVTPLRNDILRNLISKDSPLGSALIGHRVGDRVEVRVNESYRYTVEIRALKKGKDDATLRIN